MGTGSNTDIDPGVLSWAPIGTADPTDATTVLPGAWKQVGFTEAGNTFSHAVTLVGREVAEELEPIAYDPSGRAMSVAFVMAELTALNFATALNLGVGASVSGGVEPPDLGDELRIKIVHQTNKGARWLFRQCIQGGTTEIQSAKAPQKRLIAVTFQLEKPDTAKPFKVFPNSDGLI